MYLLFNMFIFYTFSQHSQGRILYLGRLYFFGTANYQSVIHKPFARLMDFATPFTEQLYLPANEI